MDERSNKNDIGSMVQQTVLQDQPDTIIWKWMLDGRYTAKSAYNIQLKGTYNSFNASAIWRAHAQPKHKFFTWLAVQSKLLTADKMVARNWQCEQTCILCDQETETADHLCLHCPFAREVMELIKEWSHGLLRVPEVTEDSIQTWWNAFINSIPKEQRRQAAAVGMITLWNIWKERNKRIFEQRNAQPSEVARLVREEISNFALAHGFSEASPLVG